MRPHHDGSAWLGTTAGVRWLTGLGVTTDEVPDATDFRLVAQDLYGTAKPL